MRPRSVLSFFVLAAFSLSLVATSKPKHDGPPSGDAGLPPETAYAATAIASSAQMPPTVCTTAALEAVAKTVRVAESWEKADFHELILLDQSIAGGLTKAAARQNHPDDGWRFLNSPLVRDLYPTSWNVTDQSDAKNADHIRRFAAHPLFVVLRAQMRGLPTVTGRGDTFEGGKLAGNLVVARIDTGASICVVPFSAESSPQVKFKDRGITGKTLERATLDDFKTQVKDSIVTAAKAVIPGFTIDVGT